MKKEPRPDYRQLQGRHRREYREAYASPEAQAWMAAMSPAQRAEAQRLGLLEPLEDSDGSASCPSFDTSPDGVREHEPAVEDQPFDNGVKSPAERREEPGQLMPPDGWMAAFRDLRDGKGCTEEVQAFLEQDGNPRLRKACILFLLGDDTCENLALALNMSKQAFHYHVRKIQKQLGLPPMGNQRTQAARVAYSQANRRMG